MGIHKYIKSISPDIYYTFDPKDSFLDESGTSGVYMNVIENDYPMLELKTSSILYYPIKLNNFMSALSYIENGSIYKSFSSETNKLENVFADSFDPNEITKLSFVQHSSYCEVDYSEFLNEIKSSDTGIYTIHFNLFVSLIQGYSKRYSMPIILENSFSAESSFGTFSTAKFDTPFILSDSPVEFRFGYFLEPSDNQHYMSMSYSFGLYSTSNIEYYPGGYNKNNEYKYKDPLYFYNSNKYNGSNVSSLIEDPESFNQNILSLGPLDIQISNGTKNTEFELYCYTKMNGKKYSLAVGIPMLYEEYHSITLEVDTKNKLITPTINKIKRANSISYVDEYIGPIFTIGHRIDKREIKKVENIVPTKEDLFLKNFNLYIYNPPRFKTSIDNIAVFKRKLTNIENTTLYDLNQTFYKKYIEYGYTQLYDFSNLYDPKSEYYIENGTIIKNVLGQSSCIRLESKTASNDRMSRVLKDNMIDREFYLDLKDHSFITSIRYNNERPIPFVNSREGTISFKFNTSDLDGLLFANTNYEHMDSNIAIMFSYGSLEIYGGGILLTKISNFSDGNWHDIDITIAKNRVTFYIDSVIYYEYIKNIVADGIVLFGNGLPGGIGLNCKYALIGFSNKILTQNDIKTFKANASLYDIKGKITINNIAVGTNVFIYNRDTGELIEKIVSSSMDGTFVYVNRYPYTITIVATDNTLLDGRSYIVDPVEVT